MSICKICKVNGCSINIYATGSTSICKICKLNGCSINIYATEVFIYFAWNCRSSEGSHIGLFFAYEELDRVGLMS